MEFLPSPQLDTTFWSPESYTGSRWLVEWGSLFSDTLQTWLQKYSIYLYLFVLVNQVWRCIDYMWCHLGYRNHMWGRIANASVIRSRDAFCNFFISLGSHCFHQCQKIGPQFLPFQSLYTFLLPTANEGFYEPMEIFFSFLFLPRPLFLSDPTFSHILRLLENKFPGNFIGYHWIQCCYIPSWGNKAQSQLTVYLSREKGKRKKCIFKCKLTSQNIIQLFRE